MKIISVLFGNVCEVSQFYIIDHNKTINNMSVQKFTSISVEVEAIQYTGNNDREIEKWTTTNGCVLVAYSPVMGLNILTKEGRMIVSIGDYVVKEPFPTGDRDFYPCKKDIFEKRYRKS